MPAQYRFSSKVVMTPSQRAAHGYVSHGASFSSPGGADERLLHSERIQIERKTFTLSLRENPRGRFLRITEDVGGRHDTIIVPAPGLGDLLRVLTDIARLSEATPLETAASAGEDGEPVALTAVD